MNTTRLTNAIKNSEQLIADDLDHYDYDCIQTPGNYNDNDGYDMDRDLFVRAPVKLKLLLPLSEELDIVPINLKAQFEDEVTDEDDDEDEDEDKVKEQEPDEYVSRFNNLYNTNFNKHFNLFIMQIIF